MKFDADGIRKRRREQLMLRMRKHPSSSMKSAFSTNRRYPVLHLQILGSILLFSLAFVLFRAPYSWTSGAKDFALQVMTRDYNFAGTAQLMERWLGQFPSVLPTIRFREEKAVPVFSRPLEGMVVEQFAVNGSGVIIKSGFQTEVHPIAEGWVRFAGKTQETGNTVIIQHSGGKESVYGYLGEIYVKKDDWVYPDMVIGYVEQRSLYLQVKEDTFPIDPLDVIPFAKP